MSQHWNLRDKNGNKIGEADTPGYTSRSNITVRDNWGNKVGSADRGPNAAETIVGTFILIVLFYYLFKAVVYAIVYAFVGIISFIKWIINMTKANPFVMIPILVVVIGGTGWYLSSALSQNKDYYSYNSRNYSGGSSYSGASSGSSTSSGTSTSGGSTTSSAGAHTSTGSTQVSGSASDTWAVRLFNMDDSGEAQLNGTIVAKAGYLEDSGWVDVTSSLRSGDNSLHLREWNNGGGYAWGFQLARNGNVVWSDQAGEVGVYGANNDEQMQSSGYMFDQTLTLSISGNDASSSSTNGNVGIAGSNASAGSGTSAPQSSCGSSAISVGSVVEVSSNELKAHDSPGLNATTLGTAIKGTRMAVKDGPQCVDGRNWWQVSGWDDSGTLGWCSEVYLQPVTGVLNEIGVGSTVEVNYFNLNIRTQPSSDGQLITTVKQGARLRVVGGPTNVDGYNWWQVTGWDGSGQTGWCSGKYLKMVQ